LELGQVEEVV